VRGVAGSTRANRYGRDKDYFHKAREQICLIVQVETGEALGRLEEIAGVEGVDAVFIGPSDLAASMGHIGNPGHPDVQDALKGAAERLAACATPAGILAVSAEDALRYRGWGYGFVAAGVDTGLLARSVDQLLDQMKSDA
jgi:4-hydroxy-2-oxoheptanedioate aldolase